MKYDMWNQWAKQFKEVIKIFWWCSYDVHIIQPAPVASTSVVALVKKVKSKNISTIPVISSKKLFISVKFDFCSPYKKLLFLTPVCKMVYFSTLPVDWDRGVYSNTCKCCVCKKMFSCYKSSRSTFCANLPL